VRDLAEIFALFGHLLYLSLVLMLWMLVTCLWMDKVVRYLLHVDGIFLVDKSFTCFLLELVRNFLHMVSNFFLFQGYSCLKTLEEYNGIHPPPSLS
jgi:hypothetical protein